MGAVCMRLAACCVWLLSPLVLGNTLIDNVNGYTLNAAGELVTFSHLLIDDDGRVVGVGSGIPPTADRRVDAEGQTLLPGLIAPGVPVLEMALRRHYLDLADVRSRDGCIHELHRYAAARPDDEWIVAYGWREEVLAANRNLEAELSDLAERPIFLLRHDGAAAWTNASASRAAGIDFARMLTGSEMRRVESAVPPPPDAAVQRAVDDVFEKLASLGITTVHDHRVSLETVGAYEQRVSAGRLPLRVYATLAGINELQDFGKPASTSRDELTVRSVRLPLAAAVNKSYGLPVVPGMRSDAAGAGEAELVRQIELARRNGFRVHLDAGSGKPLAALNAFAAAGVAPAERHWIENLRALEPGAADYFSRLGVVASIRLLPEEATSRVLDSDGAGNAMLVGGSAARVLTILNSGFPHPGASPFRSWEKSTLAPVSLIREQAFAALTRDAARAMGLQERLGSLESGKWADFVLVDQDPFQVELERLPEVIVLATWVAGRRVWHLPTMAPPVPVAANVDLSRPVAGPPVLEPPQVDAGALGRPEVEPAVVEPFRILGAEVPARTSTRLTWSPGEYIEVASGTAPVLVVHGRRPGPVLCLTGAVHGDELNGIEIVREVLYGLDADALSGTVVGVPIVNVEGFRLGSRYLVDRRDLNRHFPGNATGSSASRIAHSLFQEVIRKCDALVDVHTGSFQRTNLPQVRADLTNPNIARLASAFREMVILHAEGGEGTLRGAATEAGIAAVTIETGAPMELQPSAVADGVRGIRSLLADLHMDDRVRLWGNPEPVYYGSTWVRADRGGISLNKVVLGQRVRAGHVLASITDPITNVSTEVRAPRDGRILGMALNQIVMPGFALFRLGFESADPTGTPAEPAALDDEPEDES